MNNKIVGAVLLVGAGLVAALGEVCAQIRAGAVTLSYYASHGSLGNFEDISKMLPPCWWIFAVAVILALLGLFFLFSRSKSE